MLHKDARMPLATNNHFCASHDLAPEKRSTKLLGQLFDCFRNRGMQGIFSLWATKRAVFISPNASQAIVGNQLRSK
jgi:hypothetical protein